MVIPQYHHELRRWRGGASETARPPATWQSALLSLSSSEVPWVSPGHPSCEGSFLCLLKRASAFKRVRQCDLVGILEVDSDWDAPRQATHLDSDAGFLYVTLQEERG